MPKKGQTQIYYYKFFFWLADTLINTRVSEVPTQRDLLKVKILVTPSPTPCMSECSSEHQQGRAQTILWDTNSETCGPLHGSVAKTELTFKWKRETFGAKYRTGQIITPESSIQRSDQKTSWFKTISQPTTSSRYVGPATSSSQAIRQDDLNLIWNHAHFIGNYNAKQASERPIDRGQTVVNIRVSYYQIVSFGIPLLYFSLRVWPPREAFRNRAAVL